MDNIATDESSDCLLPLFPVVLLLQMDSLNEKLLQLPTTGVPVSDKGFDVVILRTSETLPTNILYTPSVSKR